MQTEKEIIKRIVIDTMPTTAYHSGFAPKPDHSQWMAGILATHPRRPEQAGEGISALMRWLTEQSITHTRHQAKALQDHWILEIFRDASKEKPIVLG